MGYHPLFRKAKSNRHGYKGMTTRAQRLHSKLGKLLDAEKLDRLLGQAKKKER